MTKRQERKRRGNFTPIIGQLHPSGMNHHARRAASAGKNPHTTKGARDWRKRAWLRGMGHPRPRSLSVVDPGAVRVARNASGGLRKLPLRMQCG